jgi:phosphohistidine phosphatase
MKLYFLRHASAMDVAPSDAERALTNQGREEARIAGTALRELDVTPARVLTSPLVRAQQTAEFVAHALKLPASKVQVVDELKNGVSPSELLRALKSCADDAEVVLVGHMPSLAEHLAAFVGSKRAEGLPLGKGSIACVELHHLRAGGGELRWLMRQKQLAKVAK